ncbi:stromal 70 kda heat shock-related protein, chloroplastic [Nicotiana attenuata]|nr:stromal 70 kda heat shock-related protein, chloroplastic [Nicotiana attenuata]
MGSRSEEDNIGRLKSIVVGSLFRIPKASLEGLTSDDKDFEFQGNNLQVRLTENGLDKNRIKKEEVGYEHKSASIDNSYSHNIDVDEPVSLLASHEYLQVQNTHAIKGVTDKVADSIIKSKKVYSLVKLVREERLLLSSSFIAYALGGDIFRRRANNSLLDSAKPVVFADGSPSQTRSQLLENVITDARGFKIGHDQRYRLEEEWARQESIAMTDNVNVATSELENKTTDLMEDDNTSCGDNEPDGDGSPSSNYDFDLESESTYYSSTRTFYYSHLHLLTLFKKLDKSETKEISEVELVNDGLVNLLLREVLSGKTLLLFVRLRNLGLKPDNITLTRIGSACSILNAMRSKFGGTSLHMWDPGSSPSIRVAKAIPYHTNKLIHLVIGSSSIGSISIANGTMKRINSSSQETRDGNYDFKEKVAELHRLQSFQKAVVIQWRCYTLSSAVDGSSSVIMKLLLWIFMHSKEFLKILKEFQNCSKFYSCDATQHKRLMVELEIAEFSQDELSNEESQKAVIAVREALYTSLLFLQWKENLGLVPTQDHFFKEVVLDFLATENDGLQSHGFHDGGILSAYFKWNEATADGPKHVETIITWAKFEGLCLDVLDKFRTSITDTLRKAKLSSSNLHGVIFVGGSTRFPTVQEIAKKISGKDPNATVNLDEVVAPGAAAQAVALTEEHREQNYFKIVKGLESLHSNFRVQDMMSDKIKDTRQNIMCTDREIELLTWGEFSRGDVILDGIITVGCLHIPVNVGVLLFPFDPGDIITLEDKGDLKERVMLQPKLEETMRKIVISLWGCTGSMLSCSLLWKSCFEEARHKFLGKEKVIQMDFPELWAIFGPGVSGAVFGAGWWFWVDAVVCSSVKVSFLHYLPGIFASLAALMFNCVRKEDIDYSPYDEGEWRYE